MIIHEKILKLSKQELGRLPIIIASFPILLNISNESSKIFKKRNFKKCLIFSKEGKNLHLCVNNTIVYLIFYLEIPKEKSATNY